MRTDAQRARHAAFMRSWRARKAREAWGEWDLGDPSSLELAVMALLIAVTAAFLVVTGSAK